MAASRMSMNAAGCGCRFLALALRFSSLLRDPSPVAARTLEHVKNTPRRRVKHAGRERGLLAALGAAWRCRFGAILLFHRRTECRDSPAGKLKDGDIIGAVLVHPEAFR
jgi:hypothetical protein